MPPRPVSFASTLTGIKLMQQMRRLRLRLSAPARRLRPELPRGNREVARGAGIFTPLERVMRRSQWLNVIGGSHLTTLTVQALLRISPAARPTLREQSGVLERQRLTERLVERERLLLVQRTTQTPGLERAVLTRLETTLRRTVMENVRHTTPARLVMPLARLVPTVSATPAAADLPKLPGSTRQPPDKVPMPVWSTAPGAELTLPAQELSRVTEHVISQLDRRVLSYQERNGRN